MNNSIKLNIKFYFPLIFFCLLAYSLRRTHGFIKTSHLIYLSTALVVFTLLHFKNIKYSFNEKITPILTSIFSLILSLKPDLFYPTNQYALLGIQLCSGIIFTGSIYTLLFFSNIKKRLILNRIFSISFILIAMSYILTIVSSSNPITDVFVVTMEGADFLKQGLNPYIQSYTDIFKGRYGYVAGYVYWPGVLLSLSPFKWIFGDVRYSYIFFQLLTLLILYRLSLKLGYSRLQAKSFPLLWSLFPVTFFVLEQTWTENLIILQLCILFFFLNLKKFSYAAIALGLLCATKQYNIFLAILSFFYVYKNSSLLGAAKYTLIAITSSLLVFLPFLIWDYDSFLQTTLLDVLKYQPRGDSLSWYSWLFFHYKVKIPGYLTGIIYFTPTVLGAIYLMKKAHSSITDLLFFIVINYCIVFLFGKQAFCNYYYLIAFMILLYSIFRFKDFLGTQNFKSDSTDISGL